eukprot:275687_1
MYHNELLFFIITVTASILNSDTVGCNINNETCECPNKDTVQGHTCTLNCQGTKDQCIDNILTCRSGDSCVVNCIGQAACKGNFVLQDNGATDITVLCNGFEACSGGTSINCGSGKCSLRCDSGQSCAEDTYVYTNNAIQFVCSGPTCTPSLNNLEFTTNPTESGSKQPTNVPTNTPTTDIHTTTSPSKPPINFSTTNPTNSPKTPTKFLTTNATILLSKHPTNLPTTYPTILPSQTVTNSPIISNLTIPSTIPTNDPSLSAGNPTFNPTEKPTVNPTDQSGVATTHFVSDTTLDSTSESRWSYVTLIVLVLCSITFCAIFIAWIWLVRRIRHKKKQLIAPVDPNVKLDPIIEDCSVNDKSEPQLQMQPGSLNSIEFEGICDENDVNHVIETNMGHMGKHDAFNENKFDSKGFIADLNVNTGAANIAPDEFVIEHDDETHGQ